MMWLMRTAGLAAGLVLLAPPVNAGSIDMQVEAGVKEAGLALAGPKPFVDIVCPIMQEQAEARNLPPMPFVRLIWKESRFNPQAVSPKGAQGIAQFMPGTAEERGLDDPFEPKLAIIHSASLLADLRREFGNFGLAAAAYNAGAERVFGYSAEQAVGRHISLIIPPERIAEEDHIVASLKAGERVDHFETERRHSSGRRIWVSLTISPIIDGEGRVIAASKIARDVTRQRQLVEALEEADRKKNEFLATLAHELRNPLAPLRNMIEVLKRADGDGRTRALAVSTMERQLRQMVPQAGFSYPRHATDETDAFAVSHLMNQFIDQRTATRAGEKQVVDNHIIKGIHFKTQTRKDFVHGFAPVVGFLLSLIGG